MKSPFPKAARRLRPGLLLLACTVAGLAASGATAGPIADPFGTEASLPRVGGPAGPAGRDCALPAAPLELATAVDLALCRNPATRSAWATARQQAAALGVAESQWLPTLTGTASETRIDGTAASLGGPASPGSNARVSQRSTDAALNLSWLLYDFGGRGARIDSARRLFDAAAASADSASQQVVLGAVQAYYGVVAADAALLASVSSEVAAARSLEVARGRRDAGVATRADVLQAETAHDQAILARVQAAGQLASARGTLAVTLGAPADQSLALAPAAVPTTVPALEARIADLMAEAARQRPDLAAAEAQRDSAAADVTAARATGRPSISVGAARNYVDTSGFPSQNYNSIGVSVTVPLFTGFDTTYRVRQAEAALAVRDANAEQVRLQVSLDVWSAYAALDSAGQQLRATQALLASAGENEQVALGRYQAGVGTIVDVLTAQSAAASAQQQRIAAERGWQVARAQLALALGRLSSAAPLDTIGRSP
jgi:outer membrane protein